MRVSVPVLLADNSGTPWLMANGEVLEWSWYNQRATDRGDTNLPNRMIRWFRFKTAHHIVRRR